MQTGLVFNIQRYSVQDGPGIRTTVFLKGCPLRCWWCHNPESQLAEPELTIAEDRCVRCGSCWDVCPRKETWDAGDAPPKDRTGCLRCGRCVEACVAQARRMVGATMSVSAVLDVVLKDRIFYDESGGGVTFSGGEPLMQVPFLRALLEACRDAGLHTAVDTCGYAPREDLLTIARLTDLFLYDLKAVDDAIHRRFTGVSNAVILDNLRTLAGERSELWLRVPVVPGFNDVPEQLDAMARFAASLQGVAQVNLLPYHDLGSHKGRRLGRSAAGETGTCWSPDCVQAAAERFEAAGVPVLVGG